MIGGAKLGACMYVCIYTLYVCVYIYIYNTYVELSSVSAAAAAFPRKCVLPVCDLGKPEHSGR